MSTISLVPGVHLFSAEKLLKPAFCTHCDELIWGIGQLAYRCRAVDCIALVHRKCRSACARNCPLEEGAPVGLASQPSASLAAPSPSSANVYKSPRSPGAPTGVTEVEAKHDFRPTRFSSPTWCGFCGKFVKEILGKTGYKCFNCSMCIHKRCLEDATLQTCLEASGDARTPHSSPFAMAAESLHLDFGEIIVLEEVFAVVKGQDISLRDGKVLKDCFTGEELSKTVIEQNNWTRPHTLNFLKKLFVQEVMAPVLHDSTFFMDNSSFYRFSDKAVDEMKRALEEKELITNENDRLEVLAQCLSRINLVATKAISLADGIAHDLIRNDEVAALAAKVHSTFTSSRVPKILSDHKNVWTQQHPGARSGPDGGSGADALTMSITDSLTSGLARHPDGSLVGSFRRSKAARKNLKLNNDAFEDSEISSGGFRERILSTIMSEQFEESEEKPEPRSKSAPKREKSKDSDDDHSAIKVRITDVNTRSLSREPSSEQEDDKRKSSDRDRSHGKSHSSHGRAKSEDKAEKVKKDKSKSSKREGPAEEEPAKTEEGPAKTEEAPVVSAESIKKLLLSPVKAYAPVNAAVMTYIEDDSDDDSGSLEKELMRVRDVESEDEAESKPPKSPKKRKESMPKDSTKTEKKEEGKKEEPKKDEPKREEPKKEEEPKKSEKAQPKKEDEKATPTVAPPAPVVNDAIGATPQSSSGDSIGPPSPLSLSRPKLTRRGLDTRARDIQSIASMSGSTPARIDPTASIAHKELREVVQDLRTLSLVLRRRPVPRNELDAISLVVESLENIVSTESETFDGVPDDAIIYSGTVDNSAEQWPLYFDFNDPWFEKHFRGEDYLAFVGRIGLGAPLIATVMLDKVPLGLTMATAVRGIIATKQGIFKVVVLEDDFPDTTVVTHWRHYARYIISLMVSDYSITDFRHLVKPNFDDVFARYESTDPMVTKQIPIGIVLCKPGQTTEEEWFANAKGGASYDGFLRCVGQVIDLKGWNEFPPHRYAGGLDTFQDSHGKKSLYAKYSDVEVMFQVSSFMPSTTEGHVSKKRYIGNNVVMVVYQELGCKPFDVRQIPSQFIQIVILVTELPPSEVGGFYRFRISVIKLASDVPNFGPPIPFPPVFKIGPELQEFFIQLVINAHLAGCRGDTMKKRFLPVYKDSIETLMNTITKQDTKSDDAIVRSKRPSSISSSSLVGLQTGQFTSALKLKK